MLVRVRVWQAHFGLWQRRQLELRELQVCGQLLGLALKEELYLTTQLKVLAAAHVSRSV